MVDAKNKMVFIIDDDKSICDMYSIKLEKEGFEVKIYLDGLAALGDIVKYKPNIILLDIMMPGINGFEVLLAIKHLATSVKAKIIMFSNSSDKDNIQKGKDYGADLYLLKVETTPKLVVQEINKLLENDTKIFNTNIKKDGDESFIECPSCKEKIFITN